MDSSDSLLCLVCKQRPLAEVFQCENGHPICITCLYSPLDGKCPECKVEYGEEKIRVTEMEEVLDATKMDCFFKKYGCDEKISRSEYLQHLKDCRNRPINFCDDMNLCHREGFPCQFGVPTDNPAAFEPHLLADHNVLQSSGPKVNIRYSTFAEAKSAKYDTLWTPLLMKYKDSSFVVITNIVRKERCVVWSFAYLGNDKLPGNISLEIDYDTQPLIPLSHVSTCIKEKFLSFPLSFLEYDEEGDVVVKMRIMDASSSTNDDEDEEPQELQSIGYPSQKSVSSTNDIRVVIQHDLPCSYCGWRIKGWRYKCLQCPDNNLCEACMDRRKVPHHIYAVIRTKEHNEMIQKLGNHPDWTAILPGELEPMGEEVKQFLLMQDESLPILGVSCGNCGVSNVHGKGYHCLQCEDFDLCSECFHKNEHDHHILACVTNNYQLLLLMSLAAKRDWEPFLKI